MHTVLLIPYKQNMPKPWLFNINLPFFQEWNSELKNKIISSFIFLNTSIMQTHIDSTQGL